VVSVHAAYVTTVARNWFFSAAGSVVSTELLVRMAHVSNMSNRLQKLRSLMKNVKYVSEPLQAYIIPSEDAHQVGAIR